MSAVNLPSPWYPRLKAVTFALLAGNTAYYVFSGTWTKALDALAWLTLLALFELETAFDARFRARPRDTLAERPVAGTGAKARCPQTAGFASNESARRAMAVIRGLRLVAAAAVGATAIGYAWQTEWLDAVNTMLWIAVVVLLESEVRNPDAVARHPTWFKATAAVLYAGLGALVLVWAWRGAWFDAYDALLWLAAFAMIEMDVLQLSRREVSV